MQPILTQNQGFFWFFVIFFYLINTAVARNAQRREILKYSLLQSFLSVP